MVEMIVIVNQMLIYQMINLNLFLRKKIKVKFPIREPEMSLNQMKKVVVNNEKNDVLKLH